MNKQCNEWSGMHEQIRCKFVISWAIDQRQIEGQPEQKRKKKQPNQQIHVP